MQQFNTDISSVGERMAHIETKIREFPTTMNNLLDTHNENIEEHLWIKNKLTDIKDRSQLNSVKYRGLLVLVKAPELSTYAHGLINSLQPEPKNIDGR